MPSMSGSRALFVFALVGITAMVSWSFVSSTHGHVTTRSDRSARVGVGVRGTQIRQRNDAAYDDAYETCIAAGISSLARRLDVRQPTPRSVARAFAAGWEPAFRSGPYQGCLAALQAS
jgi:hypothetical protein